MLFRSNKALECPVQKAPTTRIVAIKKIRGTPYRVSLESPAASSLTRPPKMLRPPLTWCTVCSWYMVPRLQFCSIIELHVHTGAVMARGTTVPHREEYLVWSYLRTDVSRKRPLGNVLCTPLVHDGWGAKTLIARAMSLLLGC